MMNWVIKRKSKATKSHQPLTTELVATHSGPELRKNGTKIEISVFLARVLTTNVHSRLIGGINLIILDAKIIFKACVVNTEDSHIDQPIAGSEE
jgi:hypothetical protein